MNLGENNSTLFTQVDMISDQGLDEAIEQLVRGAALKTLTESQLGYVSDYNFEGLLMVNTLQGLENGNIKPISEAEFMHKLYSLYTGGGVSGFFSKIKKSVSKVARKVKKTGHKVARKVKQIIPVVVAGVAMYYTGGAAAPYLKKYSSVIGSKWGTWKKTMGKYLDKPPPPAEQEVEYIEDPQITNASVMIARQQLASQGININSPQGQTMLAQYVRYHQAGIAGAPQKSISTDWGKLLLPVAAGGAAIYLMTR